MKEFPPPWVISISSYLLLINKAQHTHTHSRVQVFYLDFVGGWKINGRVVINLAPRLKRNWIKKENGKEIRNRKENRKVLLIFALIIGRVCLVRKSRYSRTSGSCFISLISDIQFQFITILKNRATSDIRLLTLILILIFSLTVTWTTKTAATATTRELINITLIERQEIQAPEWSPFRSEWPSFRVAQEGC